MGTWYRVINKLDRARHIIINRRVRSLFNNLASFDMAHTGRPQAAAGRSRCLLMPSAVNHPAVQLSVVQVPPGSCNSNISTTAISRARQPQPHLQPHFAHKSVISSSSANGAFLSAGASRSRTRGFWRSGRCCAERQGEGGAAVFVGAPCFCCTCLFSCRSCTRRGACRSFRPSLRRKDMPLCTACIFCAACCCPSSSLLDDRPLCTACICCAAACCCCPSSSLSDFLPAPPPRSSC